MIVFKTVESHDFAFNIYIFTCKTTWFHTRLLLLLNDRDVFSSQMDDVFKLA